MICHINSVVLATKFTENIIENAPTRRFNTVSVHSHEQVNGTPSKFISIGWIGKKRPQSRVFKKDQEQTSCTNV